MRGKFPSQRVLNRGRQHYYSTETTGAGTIQNLAIDSNTRVIYQGFTGRAVRIPDRVLVSSFTYKSQATSNAKDTIAYGTNVVGGVSPGRGGVDHIGLPVFNSVAEASTLP